MTDRLPCLHPGCGRTFKREPGEPEGYEVVCGRHWKLVPTALKQRQRALRARNRKMERLISRRAAKGTLPPYRIYAMRRAMAEAFHKNWSEIRSFILSPEKPVGLENFLEELKL